MSEFRLLILFFEPFYLPFFLAVRSVDAKAISFFFFCQGRAARNSTVRECHVVDCITWEWEEVRNDFYYSQVLARTGIIQTDPTVAAAADDDDRFSEPPTLHTSNDRISAEGDICSKYQALKERKYSTNDVILIKKS